MCENLPYESVYFKELHNDCILSVNSILAAGAAVVSTITSCKKTCDVVSLVTSYKGRKNTIYSSF